VPDCYLIMASVSFNASSPGRRDGNPVAISE
jgi:hypothetical protein